MNEEIGHKKSGRIDRGWLAIKSSWEVFKLDKELSLVAFTGLALTGVFGVLGLTIGLALAPNHTFDSNHFWSNSPGSLAIWLVTLALIALISTYTTAAIVAGALERFRGGDPTVKSSFGAVRKRLGSLTAFGLLNMGVGQLLQYAQDRIPFIGGKIIAVLAEMAWAVANVFSVAVIVDSKEPVSPIKALKSSTLMIRKVWFETAVSQISIGLIFMLVAVLEFIIGVPLIVLATHVLNSAVLGGILGLVLFLAILFDIVLASALSGIVKAALYYYATTGDAPEHFSKELMKEAFTAKKARKIFL